MDRKDEAIKKAFVHRHGKAVDAHFEALANVVIDHKLVPEMALVMLATRCMMMLASYVETDEVSDLLRLMADDLDTGKKIGASMETAEAIRDMIQSATLARSGVRGTA